LKNSLPSKRYRTRFVAHLPDLITEQDYLASPDKKKIRIRISITGEGIEILGDSMYATMLEALLSDADFGEIERMLCG
jgi:FtsH ternary system-associated peptide